MGEIRSMHTTLGAIFGIDAWNNAMRAGPKELQDWLGWLMFGDTDAGGGVVGFGATVTDDLEVTLVRGGGLIYNSSAPSPASKWAWIYLGESTVKAIGSHHATLARYDLISLSWTQDTDTAVSVGYEGGAPASTDTQRGCQATLTVTEGTAHASPWANRASTPANHEALWYVYVPAASGAVTLVDVRRHLPGTRYRPYDKPMVSYTDVDTNAVMSTVSARKAQQDDTAFASMLTWDVTEDLPYITRGKGGTGEATDDLYPMLVPAGRTWWRSVPWVGRSVDLGSNPMTELLAGFLSLTRVNTTAINYVLDVAVPCEARGLEVVAANLRYKVTQAFDATFTNKKVDLIHVEADGTVTTIGTADMTMSGVHGSVQTLAFTMADTPVLAEGESLLAHLVISTSATGTAVGVVLLYGVDVQFKEARE